ncbi:MAG: SDR family NAD(P)-dependent oxidoreductase [Desulfosarcina sp.]|nr:SDR family NAD(P)-dependent oxidoreductase [Desulfobacterales bacterium]
MRKKIDRQFDKIDSEKILFFDDHAFNPDNVCIVTSAASGIGRATAIAAAANNLMTVGLDANDREGKMTQQIARAMGGQMIYLKADSTNDSQIEHAVSEAAKIGNIRYFANIPPLVHTTAPTTIEQYDDINRRLFRAPFLFCRRITDRMLATERKTGVVGNIFWQDGHSGPKHCSGRVDQAPVFDPEHRTGKGNGIHYFNLRVRFDMAVSPPAAMDAANLIMFGFSRFAGAFFGVDLTAPGDPGTVDRVARP